MSEDLTNLLANVMRLPASQRAELAARLLDSLDPGFDEEADAMWDDEIAQRIARIDSGDARMNSWPELR